MGRRYDHSREQLKEMSLAAARELAMERGLPGLSAQRIARKIGYSVGTLYNLYENLDGLIVALNCTTLDQIYEVLKDLPPEQDPEAALLTMARGYIDFTRQHARVWRLLFEHHLPDGQQLPPWHHERIARLFGLAERALAPLFVAGEEAARHHAARVLWSSLHGMASLEAGGKLVKSESLDAMAETLVRNFITGLRARRN